MNLFLQAVERAYSSLSNHELRREPSPDMIELELSIDLSCQGWQVLEAVEAAHAFEKLAYVVTVVHRILTVVIFLQELQEETGNLIARELEHVLSRGFVDLGRDGLLGGDQWNRNGSAFDGRDGGRLGLSLLLEVTDHIEDFLLEG